MSSQMRYSQVVDFMYILAASIIFGKFFSFGGLSLTYILAAIIFIISFLSSKRIYKYKSIYDFIPSFFTLSYVFGVILGIINGNVTSFIFSNFAGLFLFFFLYQFSIQSFDFQRILKLSKIIAIIYVAEILIYILIGHFLGEANARLFSAQYQLRGLATDAGNDVTRYFITNSSWVFIILVVYFQSFFTGEKSYTTLVTIIPKRVNNFLFPLVPFLVIVLLLYLLITLTNSKGFYLATLVSFSAVAISNFIIVPAYKKLFIIFTFVGLFLYHSDYLLSSISDIYSINSSGNTTRHEQFNLVMNRVSFWGNGLGADFGSYTRTQDGSLSYGIELTYLNLIDKLGIFGLIISSTYFFIYYKFITYLTSKKNRFIGLLGLGLTSFIWPSIGNPMLLSISYCISFLFAIRLVSIVEARKSHAKKLSIQNRYQMLNNSQIHQKKVSN